MSEIKGKEKEIEEMGIIVYSELTQYCPCCEGCVGCINDNGECCHSSRHISKALIDNDYRKANEVQKETIIELLNLFENNRNLHGDILGLTIDDCKMLIRLYAKQRGIEVEE